jgi:hypothetical protein
MVESKEETSKPSKELHSSPTSMAHRLIFPALGTDSEQGLCPARWGCKGEATKVDSKAVLFPRAWWQWQEDPDSHSSRSVCMKSKSVWFGGFGQGGMGWDNQDHYDTGGVPDWTRFSFSLVHFSFLCTNCSLWFIHPSDKMTNGKCGM